jgi:hypothetical protein
MSNFLIDLYDTLTEASIMAKKGKDVIAMSDEDLKGGKTFKVAKPGKKQVKFDAKKSKIKPGNGGNILNLVTTVTKSPIGKEEKGINFFDNIAPHVGWKIAQVLKAMGYKPEQIKKLIKKGLTLKDVLALIKKYGKDIRVIVKLGRWQGKKKNEIVQYLPLEASKDEEDDDLEDEDEDDNEEDNDDNDEGDDDDSDDDDDDDSDDDEDDDDSDDDSDDDEDDDDDSDDDDDDDDDDEDEDDDEDGDDDDDDSDDDDDDSDDDEDEDDEKPKRGRKRAAKKTPKKRAAKKTTKKGGRGRKK